MQSTATTDTGEMPDPDTPDFVRDFLVFLQQNGHVTAQGAARAQQAYDRTTQRIDVVLTELGLVSEPILLQAFADYFDLPLITPADFPITPLMSDRLPHEFVKRNNILPLSVEAGYMRVATSDPFNRDVLDAIAYFVGMPVSAHLALERDLEDARVRLYTATPPRGGPETDAGSYVHDDDIQRLHDVASEAPMIRLVNRLLTGAVEQQASDIHIEALADHLRVRYRVDGTLQDIERLPSTVLAGISSRIKILGNLNIAERRMPQDGRIKFVSGGREVDMRLSTVPTLHGENIVMRILDQRQVELDFEALGFDAAQRAQLNTLLKAPNGILLVTGPTGSGKTTTLYTALKQLNTEGTKVFTVEDPIEYQLAGVNQIQIKPDIGLDFLHCLRTILRQDPDVIMIGEMRDAETVRTAIQAALTGHLVLSTLHTNSSAASIIRLLDMGVEDYLIASSVTGIVAQRLVRRLCQACAVPAPKRLDHVHHEELKPLIDSAANVTPKLSVGCEACRHTGFAGRTSIVELLVVDDALRTMIKEGVTDAELDGFAQRQGMRSLYQSGLAKVASGETTLDEILKVTRLA